jgi:hypothetical protein
MTVRTRNRTNTTLASGEYWVTSGNVHTPHSVTYGLTERCEDVIGNFPEPNPLKIRQLRTFIPVIDGFTPGIGSNPPLRGYTNCPLGSGVVVVPPDVEATYPAPNGLAQSNLAWKILAESNPSAPLVSLPTFLGELKDLKTLPLRVKDWGGSLLRKVALGHLTWRWAIKPMLSDLSKLFAFMGRVDQRFGEIVALSRGRPLRKRVLLGQSENTVVTNNVLRHSENFLVRYRRTRTNSIKEWGTSQWKISSDTVIPKTLSKGDLAKMRERAYQTTYGITSYEALATAWELCPWSWFMDWFVPFGDMIAACNNTLGLNWSRVCYMRTCTSKCTYELTTTLLPTYTISGVPWESAVTKERFVVSPALGVSPSFLPLLDARKWSILGSLAALRLEKVKR